MSQFKESRGFRRIPAKLATEVRYVFSGPGPIEQRGVTRDVSASGALLEVKRPIDVGTLLYLSVGPKGEAVRFRALAEVVRLGPEIGHRRVLMGVEFIDLIGETPRGLDERLMQSN